MNFEKNENEAQLVYLGPRDSLAETSRKIKSAFIVDLNFSIDETKYIIEETPCVIRKSSDEDDLQKDFKILRDAGAKVLIVKAGESLDAASQETENTKEKVVVVEEESQDLETALRKSAQKKSSAFPQEDDAEITTFEIELDLSSTVKALSKDPPKTSRVYEIKEDSEEGSELLAAAKQEIEKMEEEFEEAWVKDKVEEKDKDDAPLFSFEEISKALEESQNLDDGQEALRNSALSKDDEDEFDLSFDDEAAVIPASTLSKSSPNDIAPIKEESTPQKKETSADAPLFSFEEASAALEQASDGLPEIIVDETKPPSKKEDQEMTIAEPQAEDTDLANSEEETSIATTASQQDAVELAKARSLSTAEQELNSEKIAAALPQRKSLWRELGLPMLILGGILGAANWYYFSKIKTPSPALTSSYAASIVQQAVLTPLEAAITPTKEEPEIASHRKSFESQISLTNKTILTEFILEDDIIKSFKIEITTPPPPPLSPEQIVRREKRDPWLKRITIDDLSFSYDIERHFTAKGPAKVYLENDKENNRVIATASIAGSWNQALNEISLHLSVRYNMDGHTLEEGQIIRRFEDGALAFSIDEQITIPRKE